MTISLEIAVVAPLTNTLTYSLPVAFADQSGRLVGRRALVPLGRRKVTGYILTESLVSEDETAEQGFVTRDILALLDDSPLFHPEMVDFFRWTSRYYLFPPGLVIKAALPGGLVVQSRKELVVLGDCQKLLRHAGEGDEWLVELAGKGRLSSGKTSALLAQKDVARRIAVLQKEGVLGYQTVTQRDRVGCRQERCFRPVSVVSEFFNRYGLNIAATSDFEKPVLPGQAASLSQNGMEISLRGDAGLGQVRLSDKKDVQRLIQFFREKLLSECELTLSVAEVRTLVTLVSLQTEETAVPAKELFRNYAGARKAIALLIEKELVLEEEKRVFRNPFGERLFDSASRFLRPEKLSEQQEKVLATLRPAILAQRYHAFLLYGITGSGKTEVYLRAAEETLASGRDVIVLVPEIALATQLEGQFVARFGDKVVLQHSGLRPAEKYDQYSLALMGEARVVIGARSAVFAPVVNPGLIIVDEEHDSSYKQDDSFRYNGRDLAVVRASLQNAVVILGSATPAVTSFTHGQSGKFTLLEMDQRIGEAVLPAITLVHMGKEKRVLRGSLISDVLLAKMKENLSNRCQTILLLNRRGFSAALICVHCGTPVQCPHCSVSLTLHKQSHRLVCHYCGFQQGVQVVCSQCRSEKLVPAGFGTEKVEEEVTALLPEAVVQRLDSDIAGDRQRFHALLREMHEGKIDVLIGTQMIAKGHHFPRVTLVGVVWADGGMSMPDYRAAEKSFQLITQVTGRAGRGDLPGEVVIQTLRPDHYAIEYAKNHQYRQFFAHELQLRKNPVFPPFVRLVLLRLQGRVERHVRENGLEVVRFCRNWLKNHGVEMEVLGPAPSPIDKVKDNFRYQILLKCPQVTPLQRLCRDVSAPRQKFLHSGVQLSVDVDPDNMM